MKLFTITLILLITISTANAEALRFSSLNSSDGLPQVSIREIIQDQNGFMWFATEDGIARYDGYEMETYRYDPDISSTIPDNVANQILPEGENRLWITTQGENTITVFDQTLQVFHNLNNTLPPNVSIGEPYAVFSRTKNEILFGSNTGIFTVSKDSLSITNHWPVHDALGSSGIINTIWEGDKNKIWLATNDGKLGYFSDEGEITKIDNDVDNIISVKTIDNFGDIVVAGRNGILKIDYINNALIPLFQDTFLKGMNVKDVVVSPDGRLWIATRSGLIRFDRESRTAVLAEKNVSDENSLPTNNLTTLYISDDEILWIGTTDKGVVRTNLKDYGFSSYNVNNLKTIFSTQKTTDSSDSFKNNMIWSIHRDKRERLWIGHSEGLSLQEENKESYTNLDSLGRAESTFDISESWIMSIHETENHLWFGTWGEGLIRSDIDTQEIVVFSALSEDPKYKLSGDIIRLILWDKLRNVLWVGTHRNGLNQINLSSGVIKQYLPNINDSKAFPHPRSRALFLDKGNTLWVGSGRGLAFFDEENDNFQLIDQFPKGESFSDVRGIFQTNDNTIWTANGYGLDRINIAEKKVEERLLEKDGLSRSALYGIVPDNNSNLWIPTIRGLTQFDPVEKTFNRYFIEHNIQANEFNFGANWKEDNGDIILGGISGITKFNPDAVINEFESNPPVLLSIVAIDENFQEELLVGVTKNSVPGNLVLDSDQRSIVIDFTVPEYTFNTDSQFQYKLNGNDEKWITADIRDVPIRYTNLPTGSYTFQVRALDDTKENINPLKVNLLINPMIWETQWFRLLLTFSAIASLIILYSYLSRMRLNSSLEAMRMQHHQILEHELSPHLRQANNNLRNLSNISSDLDRAYISKSVTPLMDRSLRFLNNVRDIIDFEHASKQSKSDYMLEDIVDEVLLYFGDETSRIDISKIDDINIRTHTDAIYLLLTNLISNALKYSDINTNVYVDITAKNNIFIIKCKDSGQGISIEKRDMIYEKYTRLLENRKPTKGLGLGLTIVKSIVKTYNGEISILDNYPKGSIFVIELKGIVFSE